MSPILALSDTYSGGSTGGGAPVNCAARVPSPSVASNAAAVSATTTTGDGGAFTGMTLNNVARALVDSTSPVNDPALGPTNGGKDGGAPPLVTEASGGLRRVRWRKMRRYTRNKRSQILDEDG